MKKTISISVSNMLFHVEEDACDVLQNYLSTLKNHFANEEGGEEIYNDIQARAAEILQSKNNAAKQVITLQDVNDLISKLGTPADFGLEENTNQQKQSNQSNTNFTYGNTNSKTKRLYRDTDNKVVGGICSGIGYYFGFDPVWLRIALAASLLFYGFGLIPYIILLIVVPKAETTAEKLEMRGEPVNVDTISKMMQDELKGVGTRVGKFGAEMNENISKNSGNFFSKFFGLIGEILSGIFRVIGKIITVFLIVLGCILFFSLIPLVAAFVSGSNKELSYFINGLFPDQMSANIGVWSLVLLCLAPVIALLYHGIRLLVGQKEKNKTVGIVIGLLVTFGVAGLVYAQIKLQNEFEYTAEKPETEILTVNPDTLKISSEDNGITSKSSKVARIYRKKWFWNTNFRLNNLQYFESDSNEFFGGRAELDISLADSSLYELIINKKSSGSTKVNAKSSAERIQYNFKTKNNELVLNKLFVILKDEKWRNQDVELELKVPENKMILIDKNLNRLLKNIKSTNDLDDYELTGKYLKMTKSGLTCTECNQKNVIEINKASIQVNTDSSSTSINMNTSNKDLNITINESKSEKAKSVKRELMEERKRKSN